VHLLVYGCVQGVGFRYRARAEAVRLGVTGWVRNRPDGSVEAVAEGKCDAVATFAAWCRTGPPAARVSRVDEAPAVSGGAFKEFAIRY
jgi:acylphosphatase